MAAPCPEELRREFLLDPEIAFLNHGSFGSCPQPVFERYQAWQRELEREPIDFLDRRLPALLDEARAALAEYVGCPAEDLAFVQNATTGVNLAARSLALEPGDEVLATDLEYGACDLAWEWVCDRAEARYVRAPIPLPLGGPTEVVDGLFARASERTRAVFVSHVASTTGLILPVEEIVARARELGLLTIIDGAHAPAQVRLDLAALGADFYSGNAHKWLGAPKAPGSSTCDPSFTTASTPPLSAGGIGKAPASRSGSKSRAPAIPPPGSRCPTRSASRPTATGTPCATAATSSPARPDRNCATCWERSFLAPDSMVAQMAAVRLPRPAPELSERLFARHRVEIPVGDAEDDVLRLSVAAYTTRDEIDRLLAALVRELDAEHGQQDE